MPTSASAAAREPAASPSEQREQKILEHLPLVKAIARRVRDTLPVQVELDDLVHAGILGLFDAVDKFRSDKNVVFHLYAKHRIRGAILDSLRQLDWASRDQRKRYKSIEGASYEQAQQLGRAPNEEEVASAMGLTQQALQKQKRDLQQAGLTSGQPHKVEKVEYKMTLESAEAPDESPDTTVARVQLRAALNIAAETLPPRYRRVIRLYYAEERTMKQIGAELGVNESRVSQIHKAALQKLAVALRGNGYQGPDVFLDELTG